MANLPQFSRPTFEAALAAWKDLLQTRGFPTDLIWLFDENLIFEKDADGRGALAFQTRITPPPDDAERIAFNYFCDFEARLVFYRIGSSNGKSVCLMLCDPWFEDRGEKDGFVRKDEWLMSYFPGNACEIAETSDATRWEKRMMKDRPLHDLDFSMTLRAIHEILAHGRVLTSYEHYALRLLHGWSHLPGRREP